MLKENDAMHHFCFHVSVLTVLVRRVDTEETWRLGLRDMVANGPRSRARGPKQDKLQNYDGLFREILPEQVWGIAQVGPDDGGDGGAFSKDPYVMVKEVTHALAVYT